MGIRAIKVAFCIVSLLIMTGCVSSYGGNIIPADARQHIIVKETTTQEVLSLLGPPFSKTMTATPEGTYEVWSYTNIQFHFFAPSSGRSLIVTFNTDGKVVTVTESLL